MFLALTQFMESIKDNETATKGVQILLSAPIYGPKNDFKGWQDGARAYDLKQRVRYLAPAFAQGGKFDKWFDARCKIKRVARDASRYNHCKVTSVDGKLLCIGSDNAYPNYNEEHGIWIDDESAIKAWYDTYFKLRWDQAADAYLTPDAEVM